MPFSCLSGLFPLNEDDESDYTMELTLPAARSSDGSDEEIVAEWSVIRRSSPVDSSSRKTEASLIDSGGLGGLGASSVARQVM